MTFRKYSWLITSALIASLQAAERVNLNVTGNIVASPCQFNGGINQMDVDLGDIQASNMVRAGSVSQPINFTLLFSACPAGTSRVTVTFTGHHDPIAGVDYYQSNGTATNVAIGIRDPTTGALKGSGTDMTQQVLPDRTAAIPVQAFVYSAAGHPMPGSLRSVVLLTMQYN
ncbi:fimbrial protein, partial [Huaxiibacter chinensis]|uniref:fimbrial protein n=1 Tax=Huaxiibacter chinensis TaxID=2899785 RepID=UPI003D321060